MLGCDGMRERIGHRPAAAGLLLLLALLAVASCSGIEPYEVRNRREEGPEMGVFTGSQGEFVIFRYEDKSEGEAAPESGAEPEEEEDPERAPPPP